MYNFTILVTRKMYSVCLFVVFCKVIISVCIYCIIILLSLELLLKWENLHFQFLKIILGSDHRGSERPPISLVKTCFYLLIYNILITKVNYNLYFGYIICWSSISFNYCPRFLSLKLHPVLITSVKIGIFQTIR